MLDSIGELAGLYSLADAVFVGGSLVPRAGTTFSSPRGSRSPGFRRFDGKFSGHGGQFLAAKAAVQVPSGQQLGKVWVQLIEDKALRERMGRRARELSERNRGATARALDRIAVLLATAEARA